MQKVLNMLLWIVMCSVLYYGTSGRKKKCPRLSVELLETLPNATTLRETFRTESLGADSYFYTSSEKMATHYSNSHFKEFSHLVKRLYKVIPIQQRNVSRGNLEPKHFYKNLDP